jgi:hypothetical protein
MVMKCARAVALIPVVMVGLLTVGLSGVGNAQGPYLQPTPSQGSPGSVFTITFGGFSTKCPVVNFYWDSDALLGQAKPTDASLAVRVPAGAGTGTHYLYARNDATCGQSVNRVPFLVLAPTTTRPTIPPTTTTTPPTVPPTIPVTTRPPTTRPTTTTTRPPTVTTVPTTTTDTTAPTGTDTTATSTNDPGGPGGSGSTDDDGDLVFDKPAVQAGDPLAATGKGCTPSSRVVLTSGGERVGAATADSHGGFTTPVEFTRIEPGRHTVTAECGVVLTGAVDLILTSSSNAHTGTLVVLVFFVLAMVTLVARSRS